MASVAISYCALLTAASLISVSAAELSPEQTDLFEREIRPILAENCYRCHSDHAEKLKGGLRLDTAEHLHAGGKSGPEIVPGDPDASRLIQAVRYTDPHLQMPPEKKRLRKEAVERLESWVKLGAPFPPSSGSGSAFSGIAAARERHWAFQPVKLPALPSVNQPEWVKTPVDAFVLAALEKHHLKPAAAAGRHALIRRVTYDLIGLPPTFEDVQAFESDPRPDAYARLIDCLLNTPHYGERWGRYWLDVARYADTKGYLAGGEERRYAFSYTYRDYVVGAFNEDKPYDRFIIEQIAADKLPLGDDKSVLAALGFLTLGRRFLNNQHDIIDDRIDVVTRGTLGLTVTCARCHDHKFDPIPTRDYYALHGVFASSEEPRELPLLGPLKDSPQYQDYLKQKAKIEAEIPEFKDREIAKFVGELRQQVGQYLLGAHEAAQLTNGANFDTFAGERKLNPPVLRRWMAQLEQCGKKPDAIFGLWTQLAAIPDAEFSARAKPCLAKLAADPAAANPVLAKAFAEKGAESLKNAAATYTDLFKNVEAEWQASLAAATKEHKPPPNSLPDPDREALRQAIYSEGAALNLPKAEAESILARRIGEGTAPIRNRIEALGWTHPGAPARAMALADRASPANSHILLRGNPSNPGDDAPRRFLEVLSEGSPINLTNGSGRLDLARAIASRDNPLTARVYVNRVWLHHFGEPLVSTPGDFGVRTSDPVHRDLLDYLAAEFMDKGWSTKALHRLILLSTTYQQSCVPDPAALKNDPENRLLSRMNRQRLDFEALRDTLLALAGKLDPTVGGLPVDIMSEPFSTRRTLYGFIDRQNLPGTFRTFDFANPDTSSQLRFRTTVPQQALFLMNSPFVLEQARNLAQRPEVTNARSPAEKIAALYRLAYQRSPATNELNSGQRFIETQSSDSKAAAYEKYAQVLLLSNELMFLD
jgi:hypothetical protein